MGHLTYPKHSLLDGVVSYLSVSIAVSIRLAKLVRRYCKGTFRLRQTVDAIRAVTKKLA